MMMETFDGCIYQILNKINGNRYIGFTINFRQRVYQHRGNLRKGNHENSYLQRSWNKYGEEAFSFEVLERIEDLTGLPAREMHWIKELKPEYNLTDGGDGILGYKWSDEAKQRQREAITGRIHSEETKQRQREAAKERWKDPEYIQKNTGKKLSNEHKQKISEALKARYQDPEQRKKRSKIMKELCKNPEYRQKMSEGSTGKRHTEETKQKMSEAQKARYARERRERESTKPKFRRTPKSV